MTAATAPAALLGTGQPGQAVLKNTVNAGLTPKRPRPVVENDAYAAFAHRILRACARRIAGGDIESLPLLTALAADIDTTIGTFRAHSLRPEIVPPGVNWALTVFLLPGCGLGCQPR